MPRPREPRKPNEPAQGAPRPVDARMTVEELAGRTGMSVRNLRELQTRRLLDHPELEGRKGWYGERHLARVALVARLQDRGYSLAAIGDLLQRWASGVGMDSVLGLEDAIRPPAKAISNGAIAQTFPELAADPRLLAKARAAGVVAVRNGALWAPSPELLQIARTLADAGIPLEALLAELTSLRGDARRIAGRCVAVFEKYVFAPLARQGLPADRVVELTKTVSTLRPAVAQAVALAVAQAFEEGVAPPRTRSTRAPTSPRTATRQRAPRPKARRAR